jgi:hypothetical protein
MSSELDNIQLSPLLVGELYKDALLFSPDGPPALQPQRPPEPAIQRTPKPQLPEPAPQGIPQAPQAIATQPAPPQRTSEPSPKPQPAAAQSVPESPEVYKFLGKNNRKITIVVQSPGVPFLPDNQLSFLTKILEACRMNIGDVAIVNAATTPVNITTLRQQLEPSAVLLFGLEPTAIKLPINFPVFKNQPYDNCSYLAAPPLTQLVQQSEESKLLKSKLWVCLKSLFNV